VSTTKELLGIKSNGSGLERREYGRRVPLCLPHDILYPQKLALTSPTSGGRSQTEATELLLLLLLLLLTGGGVVPVLN
jgi:hypothetical protein